MNVPLATAAAVPGQFAVLVPNGVSAGQMIQTSTPDGQQVQVQVPPGCGPGSQFMVSYQPQAVAMAAPVQHAMAMGAVAPAGLHYWPGAADPFAILQSLSGVSIKQQINWAEVLVGWDQPEKYLISDPVTNRDLFVAAERSDGVMGMLGRQVFEGGSRPFNLDIAMLTGPGNAPEPFVRLQRPFACTCLCFGRPRMHIYNALTNSLIASTVEPYSCCHLRIGMNDEAGGEVLKVDHHCCDCSLLCWGCPCGCQETNFEVYDGNQVVPSPVQSPQWKAALIAMALFLDYCYFVKGGSTARRESALGRAIDVERRWNNDN